MTALLPLVAAAVPFAVPVETAPEDISPGVLGFLVTLAVVLACIPLFRSMTAKVRGVRYRDRADAAAPAPDDAVAPPAPDAVTPPSDASATPDEAPVDRQPGRADA